MRAVKNDETPLTVEGARTLEQQGEFKKAVALYEKLLKQMPSSLKITARLIILYRKLKEYKKEFDTINKAIKIHEQLYAPRKNKEAVTAISKKLNVLLGHTDKKGKGILVTDEVSKLEKRKNNLQKKYLSPLNKN